MLSAKDILAVDDRPTLEVEVPEWDGSVYVKAFSGKQRHRFETAIIDGRNISAAEIVAECVVDENGEKLFTEEDVDALEEKSADALGRIVKACASFNRLTGESIEEAGKD